MSRADQHDHPLCRKDFKSAIDEKAFPIVGAGAFNLTLGSIASAPTSTIPALASVIEQWG